MRTSPARGGRALSGQTTSSWDAAAAGVAVALAPSTPIRTLIERRPSEIRDSRKKVQNFGYVCIFLSRKSYSGHANNDPVLQACREVLWSFGESRRDCVIEYLKTAEMIEIRYEI